MRFAPTDNTRGLFCSVEPNTHKIPMTIFIKKITIKLDANARKIEKANKDQWIKIKNNQT